MKSPHTEWTDARFKSFITSLLRSGMRRFPPKSVALAGAKTTRKINAATGRLAFHYLCSKCKGEFSLKGVQVDHTNPVVCPKQGFVGWDVYIERLFCSVKNFKILCKPCHKIKTDEERQQRSKKCNL